MRKFRQDIVIIVEESAAGLSIGVNWYLTTDEKHNGDGCHVEYLDDEYFRACDEELWPELKNIVKAKRQKSWQGIMRRAPA